ncbi:hypothetical protein [Ferrimicrobium sp.]|uniref:hypothetical protein n=1 Tax=Ferrimicrobium sp. TaxID=2926050 RepID=UPI0026220C63|nr:hypothetical protein [Ferrimicrobium sp.]
MLEIRGPGHHERSQLAALVVRVLSAQGHQVWVRMDLRPRLASDIAGVLDEGAARVLLVGEGMFGMASREDFANEVPVEALLLELRATADPLGLYDPLGELSSLEAAALRRAGVTVDGVS